MWLVPVRGKRLAGGRVEVAGLWRLFAKHRSVVAEERHSVVVVAVVPPLLELELVCGCVSLEVSMDQAKDMDDCGSLVWWPSWQKVQGSVGALRENDEWA